MRLGPGKHLKGLSLFNGLVKPEEVSRPFPFVNFAPTYSWRHQFDYFHEVRDHHLWQYNHILTV